jgi:fructoselysine 6-kinase
MKLIGIGDNVIDYYKDQNLIYPGGNALNVAVMSKRNGAQECAYLGIIGNDSNAKHVLSCLKEEEINVERVRFVTGINGEVIVSLNDTGDRVFVGTNKETRVQSLLSLRFQKIDMNYINKYDVIHTSINSDINHELIKLSHKAISYDFSTPEKWNENLLSQICPFITYAFFSGSELSINQIYSLFDSVHQYGVNVVGVTRGDKPAIFSENGEIFEQQPLPTELIDTMGAGDSFIAGFLTHYHEQLDIKKALLKAAESAAKTCKHHGAFGYPKYKKEVHSTSK